MNHRASPRVLLYCDSDVFAGTERHIFDLAVGLRVESINVMVACPSPSPLGLQAEAAHIHVIPIGKRGLIDRNAISVLGQLLQSRQVDIIHAHNGRTVLQAILAVNRTGAGRCVMTQHFLDPSRTRRRGLLRMLSNIVHRFINRRVDHFVGVSEASRRAMLRRGDATEERITVIPNGIPASCANPSIDQPIERSVLRAQFGVGPDTPLIVTAARLEREKSIDVLVRAMGTVAATYARTVCLIAGEGAQRADLSRQVDRLGLQNVVRLLGFRNDAASLIAVADVFVLPSEAEPFGLVLLEAMALGRAVVATRAGGPMEIIVDGATGLLVPPGDADAMAKAMLKLISDPKMRSDMGERGRQRFHEKFTAQRMARETLKVYQKVLGRGSNSLDPANQSVNRLDSSGEHL